MTEIRQKFTFDDDGLLKGLKAIKDVADSIEKAFDEMSDGSEKFSKENQKAMKESREALDKFIDSLEEEQKQKKKSKKETAEWRKEINSAARDINIFGVNVGKTVDKLKNLRSGMVASSSAIGGGTKALKAFKIALASTGIGLLIVALGSLVSYFTRTQRGLDKLSVAFAGIKSVIDNVIDRISRVGEGFVSIISGDFRKGFNQIKTSFAGIGDEIRKDVKASTDLEKRQQELIKMQRALGVEEAKRRTEIEKLREETRKEGISREEAIKKLEKAYQLEDELAAKREEVARENLAIITARNDLAESFNEDLDAQAEAEAELARIEGERASRSRELLSETQSLRNQSAAQNAAFAKQREAEQLAEQQRLEAIKTTYLDLVDAIEDKLATQELEKLSGRERLAAERAIALEEIDLLEQKAKAAALAAGEEFNLAEKFLQIRENIVESYKEEARALDREENAIVIPLKPDLPDNAQENADRAAKQLGESLQKGLEKNKDLFQEIKIQMAAWMGLDANEMAIFEDSARTLFNTIGDLYTDSINKQIDENQKLIDSLQERGDAVEEELNRELELQEKGRANNVEGKRAELAAIRKEEERAQKEALKLQRRQQAAQLAANAAQQISNLVTGVTGLLNAGAKGGVLGLGVAALAIPAFLSLFKQAKAQARGAVGQRAFKGGVLEDYIDPHRSRKSGFIKRGGKSDIPGRGDGYRIEGTDVVVGGDEFMTNEQTSRRQAEALKMINSGAYDNIDLAAVLRSIPGASIGIDDMHNYNRLTSIRQHKIDRHKREHKDKLVVDTLNRNFRDLIRLQKEKEELYPLDMVDKGYMIKTGSGVRVVRK